MIQHRSHWPSDLHHLLAWVLSVETARQHYPETCLVTDDAGARMLVEGLGLPFTYVSIELNRLAQYDPEWWALGKIYAYHLQTEPFIHIDSDVFLWKRLTSRIERADVFAQCPEPFESFTFYRPEQIEQLLLRAPDGWLPDAWLWYRHMHKRYGACCGVFGGQHIQFIKQYAEASLRLISDPRNQKALQTLSDKHIHMIAVEQYSMTASVEYHNARAEVSSDRITLEYLFKSMDDAWNPEYASEVGFTHLVSGSKLNPLFAGRLENRVRQDYPEYYERCIKFINA